VDYKRFEIKSEQTIFVYVYFYKGAKFALEQAQSTEEGSFYNCLNSNLLSALCFEAFLNHVGQERLSYWNTIERKLNPLEKLEILQHELKLTIDYSRRPFQTIKEIIQFRNFLAHGKTETLKVKEIQKLKKEDKLKYPESFWQKNCKISISEKYLIDVEEYIKVIYAKAGLGEHPFIIFSVGTASVERSL